jgi:hypothetical protein
MVLVALTSRTLVPLAGTQRNLAPGGKDRDVCDLVRGRGVDASLHAEGLIPVGHQLSFSEETFDLLFVEP